MDHSPQNFQTGFGQPWQGIYPVKRAASFHGQRGRYISGQYTFQGVISRMVASQEPTAKSIAGSRWVDGSTRVHWYAPARVSRMLVKKLPLHPAVYDNDFTAVIRQCIRHFPRDICPALKKGS